MDSDPDSGLEHLTFYVSVDGVDERLRQSAFCAVSREW